MSPRPAKDTIGQPPERPGAQPSGDSKTTPARNARNKVSVIVPTLNEEAHIAELIASFIARPGLHEILIVDGGSTDATCDRAEAAGATVITAPLGRGPQLRAGAEAASGDVLLFIHADCRFPQGGLTAVLSALDQNPDAVGGNFRLLFDGDEAFSGWLHGFYAKLRSKGFYYGDSGIFARRDVYQRIGGIRPIALMEDYDFVRRMERAGPTLCIDEPPLTTSSRRFKGRTPRGIIGGWIVIHVLFYLKIPPSWLARLYDSQRRRASS